MIIQTSCILPCKNIYILQERQSGKAVDLRFKHFQLQHESFDLVWTKFKWLRLSLPSFDFA